MSTWTCGDNCVDVTWAHIVEQLKVAVLPLVFLTGLGVVIPLLSPERVADARGRLTKYEYGLGTRSVGSLTCILSVHTIQCILFVVRSTTRRVEMIYYAFEVIGSLVLCIDVFAAWSFTVSSGALAVLASALSGRLVLDVLITCSVVGIALDVPGKGQTWFSFGFLASLRMLRLVNQSQKTDAYSGRSSWRRQIAYHAIIMLLFIYFASAFILVLELLELPAAVLDVWELNPAMVYAFSTIITLGDTKLVPKTVLGQVFAIGFICWGFWHLISNLGPLIYDDVLGYNQGRGSYRPRPGRRCRHVIIVGTPTAPMLWEFLLEIYHPNHFNSIRAFDRQAPDVVVLIKSMNTLAHFRRYLARRESLMFRHRVTLLRGEAFNVDDLKRVAIMRAKLVVVLPNLGVADVVADDAANILRTYSLQSVAPELHVICLLQREENRPSATEKGEGGVSYATVEAFKMSLLAKASLTSGVLTFVSNLCKTTSGEHKRRKLPPWRCDYERSLGCEMYEVDISRAYHGAAFWEVCEDVLARSDNGDVYLVGFTARIHDTSAGHFEVGNVRIHPGADHKLIINRGRLLGVFVAPDVAAIKQCQIGEPLMTRSFVAMPRGTFSKFSNSQSTLRALADTPDVQAKPSVTFDSDFPHEGGEEPVRFKRSLSKKQLAQSRRGVVPPKEAPKTPAQQEQELAVNGYKDAMEKIRHRLMVHGVDVDVIGGLPAKVELGTAPKTPVADADHARSKSAPPPLQGTEASAAAPAVNRRASRNSAYWTEKRGPFDNLTRIHAVQAEVDRDTLFPPKPPAALLEFGGHLLLCVVSDTTCGAEGSGGPFCVGPSMRIDHFMRPLRDKRTNGHPTLQPAVVILAEAMPDDWYKAVMAQNVFFVFGSALSLRDLEKAGFRQARAIAIARGHSSGYTTAINTSDAQMVLATNLIEKNLPPDSQTQVVTDHAYTGSCEFLPLNVVQADLGSTVFGCYVGEVGNPYKAISRFFGEENAVDANVLNFGVTPCEENYEELQFTDYAHHPRFMRGQVFMAPTITSILANSFYNPALLSLIDALVQAPILLLPLPPAWERYSYADFTGWLLRDRNLLALGLYRSAQAAQANASGKPLDDSIATHYYLYAAPPAHSTFMIKSDRILCVVPTGA